MKNLTPLILIILAIGLFFTYTDGKIEELKTIQAENSAYLTAIENSKELISKRDSVLATYNTLTDQDKANLNKLLPDNVDNVRLIIDVNNIAARHGISLQGLSTSADDSSDGPTANAAADSVNGVTISFSFAASYQNFLSFMKDIESSLRILDISNILVSANSTGAYNYSVGLKTYWLSQ